MRTSSWVRTFLATGFAAILVALSPTASLAQLLRGTVRDSASREPISGAVLVLLDSAGRSLGRNITNERGEYAINLSRDIRRMQILRIGFRPRDVAIPLLTTGTAQLDVAMMTIPTLLQALTVTDQPACSRRNDRAAAFALWEQARAGLLATVVAREANPAHVVRLHFIRRFSYDGDNIVYQSVRIDSAATSRPFVARHRASVFVDSGFVDDSASARLFSAPDADVMLDSAFVRGYCFHIAESNPARPREIGLGFAPAGHKRGRIDIEGAVWIDTVTRTLDDIAFRYLDLGARYDRFHPGGRIGFRAMENGTVLIDRWFIRTVSYAPPSRPGMTMQQLFNRPLEARESGGEVAHARWNDGREWQASLGTLRGRVTRPAAGPATIQLVDTDYRATTDSAGVFEISNLLPGPYSVAAVDEHVAALGVLLRTPTAFVAVRDSIVTVSVDVSTGAQYATAKCQDDVFTLGHSVLIIRVVLQDGSSAVGARVEIRAVDADGNVARLGGGETDDNGLFHFCRAPQERALQIRAELTGLLPAVVVKEVHGPITTTRLQLKTPRPAPPF